MTDVTVSITEQTTSVTVAAASVVVVTDQLPANSAAVSAAAAAASAVSAASAAAAAASAAVDALFAGIAQHSVLIANASGLPSADSDLTFDGTTLSTAGLTVTNAPTFSAMTAGRVLLAGTAGLLTNSAGLTFNSAGTAGQGLAISSGTATTDVQALSSLVEWSNSGQVFSAAYKWAVKDTNSAAGSLHSAWYGGAAGTTALMSLAKGGTLDIYTTSGIYAATLHSDGDLVRPGIKMTATRPTTTGIAFSLFDLYIGKSGNTNAFAGTFGVYGNIDTVSSTNYLMLDARPNTSYTNATLKIGTAGIGVNVSDIGVPSGSLTMGASTAATPGHGETWTLGSATELLTLSTSGTTTDTTANLLPANSIIESVVARVTTTITTATDWELGDATTPGRFAAPNSTMTAGATSIGLVQVDQTGAAGPRQTSAAKVRVTTTGTPGAGVIRITVFYRTLVAPTS